MLEQVSKFCKSGTKAHGLNFMLFEYECLCKSVCQHCVCFSFSSQSLSSSFRYLYYLYFITSCLWLISWASFFFVGFSFILCTRDLFWKSSFRKDELCSQKLHWDLIIPACLSVLLFCLLVLISDDLCTKIFLFHLLYPQPSMWNHLLLPKVHCLGFALVRFYFSRFTFLEWLIFCLKRFHFCLVLYMAFPSPTLQSRILCSPLLSCWVSLCTH